MIKSSGSEGVPYVRCRRCRNRGRAGTVHSSQRDFVVGVLIRVFLNLYREVEIMKSLILHQPIRRLGQASKAKVVLYLLSTNVVLYLLSRSYGDALLRTIYNYIESYKDPLLRKVRKPIAEDVSSKVDESRVDSAIQKAAAWLENALRKSDDHCIHGKWEIWDTANVVLALLSANVRSASVKKAVSFILGNQKSHKGFLHRLSGKEEEYCTEATSVSLMAAYKYKGRITSEIEDGIHFLLKKQRKCGGWEVGPYLGPKAHEVNLTLNYHPSVTGFALQPLLVTKNITKEALEKALKFLENTQRSDGSWGRSLCYYSTEGYAISSISSALALARAMNLSDALTSKIDRIFGSCISYAKSKQNHDGSWSIKGPSTKALATSLFLQSLSNASERGFTLLGINWLIQTQKTDGYWKGGTLDSVNQDTYVTAQALIALIRYKALLSSETN